jgi:hypothetical protein
MKNFFLIGIAVILLCNLANAQIQMNSAGKVGINATPESIYELVVGNNAIAAHIKLYNSASNSGLIIDQSAYYSLAFYPTINNKGSVGKEGYAFSDIYYYTPHQQSDARQKENIRDIKNPLKKIIQLRGIEYDLKREFMFSNSIQYEEKVMEKLEKDRKDRLGFLAQDVEKVIPEAVFHDDSLDTYSMDYSRIIPVLVEAIKEQQLQIDSLKKKIKENFSTLKSASTDAGIKELSVQNDAALLEQNVPNPFSVTTTINFYIPQSAHTAAIYIYDMQGTQMKAYSISSRGKSTVGINGSELLPGMYLYTLIVDGKEVNTLKMILTE